VRGGKHLSVLGNTIENKKQRISAIGTLSYNLITIDDFTIEWVDAEEFSIAALAKTIGIDVEHKARARITIEITEEPCELCGKPTTGNKICERCGKLICDGCAKTNAGGRYCPACSTQKLLTQHP
jgi:formylmethanofuran dehydrogenase subunit E